LDVARAGIFDELFDRIFRASVLHVAAQRYHLLLHLDLDVAGIDSRIVRQPFANRFQQAFI
jgi:hypothetical protein